MRVTDQIGFLLQQANIRNACFVYFLVAPALQDNKNTGVMALMLAISYAITGIIVALACMERLSTFSHEVRVRGFDLIVLAMISLCLISVLVNEPFKLLSLSGFFWKYGKLVFPVTTMFVMISIWNHRDLARLYVLLLIVLAASLAFLVPEYLVGGVSGGIPRLSSFHIDANKYAMFLNVVYGITLPLLIHGRLNGKVPFMVYVVLVVIVIQLVLSQSRGGLLTTMIITLYCFVPRAARPVRGILVVLGVLAAGLALLVIVQRYAGGGAAVSSISDLGRLLTYSVGGRIISDHALTGVGFARTVGLYETYGYAELLLMGQPMAIHNVFLEILAEVGIAGLLVFLMLVFVPVFQLINRIRKTKTEEGYPVLDIAALSVPVAFLGFGVFSPNYLIENHFWTLMAFTVIVLRSPPFGARGASVLVPKWF